MKNLLERASSILLTYCSQPRYRTAWLIGSPLSGKTTLARQLCDAHNWQYLNYTLEVGFFDTLNGHIETYQISDFLKDIRIWCTAYGRSVLLIDEIDAVLATWSFEQRRLFATRASRLPDLSHGLVLVSNLFDVDTLAPLLPNSDILAYVSI